MTVHEVLPENKLRELQAATGGAWGGAKVNNAFCDFISNLVGQENFQRFIAENKADYLQLLEDFESKKVTTNPDSCSTVRIKIPFTLSNLISESVNSVENDTIRIMPDKLIIDAEQFRSFFEETVRSITDHVKKQAAVVPDRIDRILLIGGFAESPLLKKAVEDCLKERFKIITPCDASLCVLKGAVLYGFNPSSVACRKSRYTYGFATTKTFREELHPLERKSTGKREDFCDDIFDKHVEIDQEVPTNRVVTERIYYPITADDKLLQLSLYRSTKKNPQFVDESGCKPVETVEIEIDTTVGSTSKDRPIKVKMIFGASDIKVLAQQNNGKPPQEADFNLNGMF